MLRVLRFLFFLGLALFVWLRHLRAREKSRGGAGTAPGGPGGPAPDRRGDHGQDPREMVRDGVCGVYVARAQALTTVARGETHFFCSAACYRRFLSGGTASAPSRSA